MELREKMRPYVKTLMQDAHEKGTPIMRPLFYDFPEDKKAWEIEDQYMFGSKVLVCPVLYEGVRERKVYLPEGKWKNINDNRLYEGGAEYVCDAPYESIPVFVKAGELEEIF